MKRIFAILLIILLMTGFAACKSKENPDEYGCVLAETDDASVEQSFAATVISEDFTHMMVEPMEWESEREISDIIKIDYQTNHYDYLYGVGRRIVIYYTGKVDTTDEPVIYTDDISTEGFREFELSVKTNSSRGKYKVLSSDDIDGFDSFGHISDTNLYYYNADEVNITVDGSTIPLEEALRKGKITLRGIISKANGDMNDGIIKPLMYDDGGSSVYRYPDYTIIKYHTIEGNRDVYIGNTDLDIDAADK